VNFTANMGQRSTIHHIDREWRFTDIGVSGYAFGHTLDISFDLQTDEGLQLGGWAIDDLCVVANRNSICGDGVKQQFEQCDDGANNADVPGSCRTFCLLPTCGDAILDNGEACDDGIAGSPTCDAECNVVEVEDGGCCSSSSGGEGALALGTLAGLLMFRRRRRA
jgi:MYXO-CTERM domain-containing protein